MNKNNPAQNGLLLQCPLCKGKTRTKATPDTILINFPLFCPKCKQETLVNVQNHCITVICNPKEVGSPKASIA